MGAFIVMSVWAASVATCFAWFFVLPTIGLLWLFGWLV